MDHNVQFNEVLNEYFRPLTFPVAVKFIRNETISEKVRRPLKEFGHPIALCQGIAMVRRYGWTMAFAQEDHACPSAIIAMGHLETPDYVKQGNISINLYAKNAAAAVRCEEIVVKLPVNSIDAILLAPLNKAAFSPDVVLIYGMPGQIVRLVQGANYSQGGALESRFGGRFACSTELIVPHMQQKCHVILPGGGERVFAMTEINEMAFALPGSLMGEVAEGLIATHKSGIQRMPFPVAGIRLQPQFPPSYGEFEEYCGLQKTSSPSSGSSH